MSKELPGPEFWAPVAAHTGEVTEVQPTARGFSSDLTAVIDCEAGRFFIKAMRNQPGGRRDSLVRERDINEHARRVAPALRWHVETGEWIVLGFEAVDGRSSDFAPGSADLPEVVGLLDRIAALDLPAVARDWTETRWDRFADMGEEELFRGSALLHTDINPSNLMIGRQGPWAVDWSWPTVGAAFIDPALLVLQLVSAGHPPEDAETWADECTAWAVADPRAVDAFAAATARMYGSIAQRMPDAEWLTAMADAAGSWAGHRGVAAPVC